MNIHEYQAKAILRQFNVKVPRGKEAYSVEKAVWVADDLGGPPWIVKAQIHAGGRGKGGGVKVANSIDEVRQHARSILGMQLVTHQTGPEGKEVKKIFVEEGIDIARELYLGMTIDRQSSLIVMMASPEGGVEIEKVAAEKPEAIHKEFIDPTIGFLPFQARNLGFKLGLNKKQLREASIFMSGLYRVFVEKDCSLAEINPLVVTKSDEIIALDAKLNFDDNSIFRHKEIDELRDFDEEDPKEVQAARYDLSYIKLDGNIACMVNGAGLAMATMDIIKLHGAEPANFLDVGGGASVEQVKAAFRILVSDENVQAILVNIFGGIMRCDVVAKGIVEATQEVQPKVPLIVRLEGTNAEMGKDILNSSGLNIIPASGMEDAASKVVKEASK
ncbi:MAG: ADP-forming succinate--CoA ligase subunit beta [Desulfobacteraceae bacterium]|nr:MAG: ADP-forming succinate--CoA ligase subunit beta [Desulfobacteraceae bacterium]